MPQKLIAQKLASINQGHVLRFYDKLGSGGREKLMMQLDALDLPMIADLVDTQVRIKSPPNLPADIKPVKAFPRNPTPELKELYERAEKRGHELLSEGKVAAFLVAGGQGTRLGYEGPKGEYPVTPVKNKPLFQVFAEQLLAHARDHGKPIPWYVMTSDINDAPTRAFFTRHNFFGYNEDDVMFFQQGMMPAFAYSGEMLMSDTDSLALSPDGHGGSLRALFRRGPLADMKKRGVEHISYFQVDNPLVKCIDPLFLGLHDITGSEMSSKTISKREPLEKVGNFVIADGKTQIIEYSDLPEELARSTNPDGSLRFNAGSIAIHALRVSFVDRLNAGGSLNLPWHRAEKKVPFVDPSGKVVKPEKPNAVKLEQFVFDAIPLAENPIVLETDRAEEFSPVKNSEGPDSPATSRRDQIRRAARWLKSAGVEVPMRSEEDPDCMMEISPLYAVSPQQLVSRKPRVQIKSGQSLYVEK